MPDLAQRQVKLAVQSRLVAAATAAGTRVHLARAWPLGENQLPALRVLALDESLEVDADEDVTWPSRRTHRLDLQVQGAVRDADDVDAALDALELQVLQALEGSQAAVRLTPLNCALRHVGSSRRRTTEGEAAFAMVTVRFEVLFVTAANDPTTIL